MSRPSFQFYPGDWLKDSDLKRCTFAEKGVWIEIMCLLHDREDEYGILRWPLKEIAEAVKCPIALVKGLVSKNVLRGADTGQTCTPYVYVPRSGRKDGDPVTLIEEQQGPIWYSWQMVKDEHVRKNAGVSTRFGAKKTPADNTPPGTKETPSHSPSRRHGANQGDNQSDDQGARQGDMLGDDQGDGSSSSSSTSISFTNVKGQALKTKDDFWSAGKSLLEQAGMPKAQCGAYIGRQVKVYGEETVCKAVREAIVTRPPDPAAYIAAICKNEKGRSKPKAENFASKDYAKGVSEDGFLQPIHKN